MSTPETTLSFTTPSGLWASVSYDKGIEGEPSFVKVALQSPLIQGPDGAPKTFSVEVDVSHVHAPLYDVFEWEKADINQNVKGLSLHQQDFFATIEIVRERFLNDDYVLSASAAEEVMKLIDDAGRAFDGDHEAASSLLLNLLDETEIYPFEECREEFIGLRETSEHIALHRDVWREFMGEFEKYLEEHPDVVKDVEELHRADQTIEGPGF